MEENEFMELCASKCLEENVTCKEKQCRKWIDFKQDLNCMYYLRTRQVFEFSQKVLSARV